MENSKNAQASAPEDQSAPVIPRYHLPDDWSGKGACPVCRTLGQLSVQHQDVTPDRMVCSACGTAFEVETAGTRIRLASAPAALAARTAGLLGAWLTPAELLPLLERGAPSGPGSPFEPLSASLAAGVSPLSPSPAVSASPALSSLSKTPTAPLAPKAANGAGAELEAEPGTEDWFASLAAVIGGTLPVKPPPDSVLADELERALLNRPENGANGVAGPAPTAASDGAASAVPVPGAALAPIPAAPETVKSSESKLAHMVLAQATAELAASGVPTAVPAAAALLPDATSTMMAAPSTTKPPAEPSPADTPLSAGLAGTPTAPEATALVPAGLNVSAAPATPSTTGGTVSRRDLAERAWKLHEMGNSLPSIQAALESSGGTPDDVGVIMAKLIALEQARQVRFRRTVQWGAAGSLLVIFILLVIAVMLGGLAAPSAPAGRVTPAGSVSPSVGTPGPGSTAQSGTPVPGQVEPTAALAYNPIIAFINQILPGDVKIANGPSPTPAPTSSVLGALFPATSTPSAQDLATGDARKSGLPSWLATLVPSGLTIIKVPTPSVDHSGPPNSPCPTTADQASALFGGSAASWSFNRQQQGWIFIIADKPTTIRVPAGMSAGYLVIGESLVMRSVTGPVTVHNVNFIAVSCQ